MPRKPRRAKLTIEERVDGWGCKYSWCRQTARNGEILFTGEFVSSGKRARAAIIRSMVDVVTEDEAGVALVIAALERQGYVLLTEEKLGKLIDTANRHIREENSKAALGVTKPGEAGR